jgi:hypothetical protein
MRIDEVVHEWRSHIYRGSSIGLESLAREQDITLELLLSGECTHTRGSLISSTGPRDELTQWEEYRLLESCDRIGKTSTRVTDAIVCSRSSCAIHLETVIVGEHDLCPSSGVSLTSEFCGEEFSLGLIVVCYACLSGSSSLEERFSFLPVSPYGFIFATDSLYRSHDLSDSPISTCRILTCRCRGRDISSVGIIDRESECLILR